jgi:hypothetical protein
MGHTGCFQAMKISYGKTVTVTMYLEDLSERAMQDELEGEVEDRMSG